jgi:hypothetical protein
MLVDVVLVLDELVAHGGSPQRAVTTSGSAPICCEMSTACRLLANPGKTSTSRRHEHPCRRRDCPEHDENRGFARRGDTRGQPIMRLRMEQSGFREDWKANLQDASYGWRRFFGQLEGVAERLDA